MNHGSKQVQAMPDDAAQIIPLQGDAVAVEEVENLDGNLAAVLNTVAKLRGGEHSIFGVSRNIGRDTHHFVDRRAQEKVIVSDFIHPSQASGELEKSPDIS